MRLAGFTTFPLTGPISLLYGRSRLVPNCVAATPYLVRETKGSLNMAHLCESERQKIEYGEAHFGELKVDFEFVTGADDLQVKTRIEGQ